VVTLGIYGHTWRCVPRLARVCTTSTNVVPPRRAGQHSGILVEARTACSLPEKCSSATPRHVSSASGSAADTRRWVRACRRASACCVSKQCTADCYIGGLGKRYALHTPLVAAPGAVQAGTGIVASALARSSAACLQMHRPRPRPVSRLRQAAKLRPRQRPAAGWTCALAANWLAAPAQSVHLRWQRCSDRQVSFQVRLDIKMRSKPSAVRPPLLSGVLVSDLHPSCSRDRAGVTTVCKCCIRPHGQGLWQASCQDQMGVN
jgi:hypothetical protein